MSTQYGFTRDRSTTDALFVAKRMIEYAERADMKKLMVVLDWEKAFDEISHKWLFKPLEAFQIPEEILGVVRGFYDKPQFCVEMQGVKSRVAQRSTGIRRGCPLSPYLFIMATDKNFKAIPEIAKGHRNKIRI